MSTRREEHGKDHIDVMLEQWRRERPELDLSPVGVIGRISRISRQLELQIEHTLAGLGLNGWTFYVLAALRRSGPPYRLTPTQLWSSLLVSSGAMTHRIDRMEQAGLVTRVPDEDDGRVLYVTLTARGRTLVDVALEHHNENEHRMLASLSNVERELLAGLLRRLLIASEAAHLTPEGPKNATTSHRRSGIAHRA